ncbi:MAG: PhoU domain-containing protein, partial [Hyphomicrobiales bacterium]
LDGQGMKTKLIHGIENLTNLGLAQLKDVLDAFAARDVDMANAVWLRDEQLDEFYTSVFRELLTYMMEDPRNITFCTHLLFCAKNIERIGDHATNIAETVVYLETGQTMTDPRKKVYEKMAPVMNGDA